MKTFERDRVSSRWLIVLGVLWLVQPGSSAHASGPDLNQIALQWSLGRFISPVVCDIAGNPTRFGRRIQVALGPKHERPSVNRITFYPLDLPEGTRCKTELEPEVPNVAGSILITLPGASRPDLAQRDFMQAMKRDGGFDFDIRRGKLRLGVENGSADTAPAIDFAKGKAEIREVRRGSDAARVLSEFSEDRRLSLELVSADGATRLRFFLVGHGRP